MASISDQWNELSSCGHAWQFTNINGSPLASSHCVEWLSNAERAHYNSLRPPELQREYLAAHALCRRVLSRYAPIAPSDWRFGYAVHGKPRIAAPKEFQSLRFNLTRTAGLTICLVSRVAEVGVDAEAISCRVNVLQLAREFLNKNERERLSKLLPSERVARFFELWVLKEAYLKGVGRGLLAPNERTTIEIDERGKPKPLGKWHFSLRWVTPQHVAAAALRSAKEVQVKWLDARELFETSVAIEG